MDIDIQHTPFSRFGSYFAFSLLEEDQQQLPAGLWMLTVHGDALQCEVLHLQVLANGAVVPYRIHATPAELQLVSEHGRVRICISAENQVRIRGEGLGLRLSAPSGPAIYNCAVPYGQKRCLLTIRTALRNHQVLSLKGDMKLDAPWEVRRCKHVIVDLTPDSHGLMESAVDQCDGSRVPGDYKKSFAEISAAINSEFQTFLTKYAEVPEEFQNTREAAAYLNWAAVVHPCGHFTRPAMLMSKNWHTEVWSWDHAFNALSLSDKHPELAWDQFMVVFDHQQPQGQLPDTINDGIRQYNYVKPPIHGLIFRKMMQHNRWFQSKERLREIYEPLSRWTNWWFADRNPDGDGLPQYHHGNDSGWDNATVFDVGLPVRGPDLAAFLIIQMEVLAEVATRLGKEDDAAIWLRRASRTQRKLLSKLWRKDRFVCTSVPTGGLTEQSESLLPCLPIVLGKRLPAGIRDSLISNIRRHQTKWGLATEDIQSPLYESDGYWRGPIWAPPTFLIVEGLLSVGETTLARDIALQFCRLCRQSGFAENFDAKTGAPLQDPAYTWTSSIFLILAQMLAQPGAVH